MTKISGRKIKLGEVRKSLTNAQRNSQLNNTADGYLMKTIHGYAQETEDELAHDKMSKLYQTISVKISSKSKNAMQSTSKRRSRLTQSSLIPKPNP